MGSQATVTAVTFKLKMKIKIGQTGCQQKVTNLLWIRSFLIVYILLFAHGIIDNYLEI